MIDGMTRMLATGAVAVVAIGAGASWYLSRQPVQCEAGQIAGGPGEIGGPFTLVSETGETVSEADVIDRPALVYFGYTFCPDVCPLDAVRNAEATDLLSGRGYDVRPVFITVDPARDTPEVLAGFTDAMHPDMLGLTGSEAQVAAAAEAYRVYYRLNDPEEDPFYLVDHSTFTYLVLPEEGFVSFFRREATPEEMAERTACYIDLTGS